MPRRPGGEMASRPLHFIWIADCSGSMSVHGKIQALNDAIRRAVPHMQAVASDNPHARVFVRAVRFSHGANWHVGEPEQLEAFEWTDLAADPLTQVGAAADVVFLLDTSGSMGDEIDGVKRSCLTFADEVVRQGANIRLGLVGFDVGGHQPYGHKRYAYAVHDLSTYTIGVWPLAAPQDFKTNIQSLSLGLFGGAGCYLADPDTIDIFPHVMQTFGRESRHHRILVIISDEIGSTEGLAEIVTMLKQGNVTAHVVGVPGKRRAHEQIAEQTGGKFWSIRRSKGLNDFSDLLGTMGKEIGKEVTQRLSDGSLSTGTDMGRALQIVAEQLRMPPMTDRALPPVLVLISDGQPTDDFKVGLRTLLEQPWGKKAVRIAVAIGDDADLEVLQQFIGHRDIKPLRASDAESLAEHIRWVSTAVLKAASAPATRVTGLGREGLNVPLPVPPRPATAVDSAGVW